MFLQVLSLHETVTAYGSVYYIGTIIPILVILLGKMIQPAKPVRSKAKKDEWVRIWLLVEELRGVFPITLFIIIFWFVEIINFDRCRVVSVAVGVHLVHSYEQACYLERHNYVLCL